MNTAMSTSGAVNTRSYQTLHLGFVQDEKIAISSKDRLHFVAEEYTIFLYIQCDKVG